MKYFSIKFEWSFWMCLWTTEGYACFPRQRKLELTQLRVPRFTKTMEAIQPIRPARRLGCLFFFFDRSDNGCLELLDRDETYKFIINFRLILQFPRAPNRTILYYIILYSIPCKDEDVFMASQGVNAITISHSRIKNGSCLHMVWIEEKKITFLYI